MTRYFRIDKVNPANLRLTIAVLLALLTYAPIFALTHHYTVAVGSKNHHCLDDWYFLVDKRLHPAHTGQYVAFRMQNVPYVPDGLKFTKMVSGTPGDKVSIRMYEGDELQKFIIAQRFDVDFRRYLKGEVSVERKDGSTTVYPVVAQNMEGKPMPMISPGIIPEGKLFVTGTNTDSYDSRYWGYIDELQIIGRAFPIRWKNGIQIVH